MYERVSWENLSVVGYRYCETVGLQLSQDKDSKPASTLKGSLVWKLVLNEAENKRCVKVELDFTTHKHIAATMVSEVKRNT